jgi:amino acid transporter
LADVAMILMGTAGAVVLTVGAIFSISGNLTASMLSAPRMVYAMAHIGSMPACSAPSIHATRRRPTQSLPTACSPLPWR